jgi:hypothetical protein
MDLRPDNCPDHTCTFLYSPDGERICYGVMAHPVKHDDLMDNLCRCEDVEQVFLNAADAFYEAKGNIVALMFVLNNGLYNPCLEVGIANPVKELIQLLEGEGK